jgi:glucose-1-phosphate cytidylyltransferase
MKIVILAGGLGTRISEESHLKPKPMIEIGGKPILWHIMKIYSSFGYNDFIICCGYKGFYIKEYFANYFLHMTDVTIDLSTNNVEIHQKNSESWKVTLVDTGELTQTGGRIKKIKNYIDGTFCLTYGDGLSNININNLISFHKKKGRLATVSAIQPVGRFGSLEIHEDKVTSFLEKPKGDNRWISGGFFVCEPEIIDYIYDDNTILEREPLENLAKQNQLSVWKHEDFWSSMDTLRDKQFLDNLWNTNQAPWKLW